MKPRVLVVDDDQAMCDLLSDGLTAEYDAIACTSPGEALARFRAEPFDAVLTDLRMKGMSGTELCAQTVAIRPEVPVIVLTSFGSLESAIEAIRTGAYDFVTKPVAMPVVAHALRRAIQSRTLKAEVRRLEEQVIEARAVSGILGTSSTIEHVRRLIERVARSDASVLITGESGTGKELVARAVHALSDRAGEPFVALNAAAVPETLLESELFGHKKGAFTDARRSHPGLFARAHGGTMFLDEVGDMPLGLQPKLLRALEERAVRPLGGLDEVPFDARVVAATSRDLEQAIADKTFREELFYRLAVVEIALPPLRVRGDDVLVLAQHFIERFATKNKKRVVGMTGPVAARLRSYAWPGNVRELSNAIERAVALTSHDRLVVDDLPARISAENAARGVPLLVATDEIVTLDELERRYILRVLESVGQSRAAAAALLGIDRKTLYRKLGRYGDS